MAEAIAAREAVIAGWRRAEAAIYPAVMVNAALYQQYVQVIRAVVDELADVKTEDDLIRSWYEHPSVAKEAAERLAVPLRTVMDFDQLRDAAYAQRHRDVVRSRGKEIARERLEEARRSQTAWVVLFDDATPLGSHRLEMHVRTGKAIHASTKVELDAGKPTYELEAVSLDPDTGAWLLDLPPIVPQKRYDTEEEWLARTEQLRSTLEKE